MLLEQLPGEWAEVFGKGAGGRMDRNGDQWRNRVDLWAERDALIAGYGQLGRDIPAPQDLFQKAVQAKFGAKGAELARRKLSAELAKNKNRITQRPTQRETHDGLTLRDRAIRNTAERMASLGMAEDDEVPDGFLG